MCFAYFIHYTSFFFGCSMVARYFSLEDSYYIVYSLFLMCLFCVILIVCCHFMLLFGVFVVFFFFFKHKTAYEVRISDWSSDVCSSDLERSAPCSTRYSACVVACASRPARRSCCSCGRWRPAHERRRWRLPTDSAMQAPLQALRKVHCSGRRKRWPGLASTPPRRSACSGWPVQIGRAHV